MKSMILNNKQVEDLEKQMLELISIKDRTSDMALAIELTVKINEISDTLLNSFHSGVDFELKVVKGGK